MKIKYSYEKHNLKWWHAPLLLLLIAGTYYIMYSERNKHSDNIANTSLPWAAKNMQRSEGMVFGTVYHITYQYPLSLDDSIKQVLQKVDDSLSPFNKNSTITAINDNRSSAADEMLTEVFLMAKTISEKTYGAFDITVAPLVNLWGFGFKNMDNVNPETVDSLMQYVGFEKVDLLNGNIIKTTPETMLDCSAIAKGYGVDAVGKMLERQGIRSYMIEIGGEVRLRGCNPHGKAWNIGITKPEDDSLSLHSEIEKVIAATDLSIATSGNYRNFYVKNNKKYAHTIDPRTGYPVQHSILSATVVAPDCTVADAYATAFMVLGLDSAKAVLHNDTTLKAFLIYSTPEGTTSQWTSPNFPQ